VYKEKKTDEIYCFCNEAKDRGEMQESWCTAVCCKPLLVQQYKEKKRIYGSSFFSVSKRALRYASQLSVE